MISINRHAKKLAGRAFVLVNRRWRGSYVFLNHTMNAVFVVENRPENVETIKSRKAKNIVVGYYSKDSSLPCLKKDIRALLQEEICKPVDEPEMAQ